MAQLSERIPGVSVYPQANLDIVRAIADTYDIISALQGLPEHSVNFRPQLLSYLHFH